MGRTTSKKMIPLLLLRILWIHADKDHMISMEYICDRLEDEFESERRMGRPALRKLVSSNIRQLNLFFHETQWCLNEGEELQICEKRLPIRSSRRIHQGILSEQQIVFRYGDTHAA